MSIHCNILSIYTSLIDQENQNDLYPVKLVIVIIYYIIPTHISTQGLSYNIKSNANYLYIRL